MEAMRILWAPWRSRYVEKIDSFRDCLVTVLDMDRLLRLSMKTLRKAFSPHGFNIGYNFGRSAGAGLESHIHMHVVPRWNGDTNFMPVLAETKVIPQDLFTTYDRLRKALEEILEGEGA